MKEKPCMLHEPRALAVLEHEDTKDARRTRRIHEEFLDIAPSHKVATRCALCAIRAPVFLEHHFFFFIFSIGGLSFHLHKYIQA